MRVLYRRDAAGIVVWYVQASLDVDTGYKEETASNKLGGVLGVDLNANGVAGSVVKPDGNQLVVDTESNPLPCLIQTDHQGKTLWK
jgi:hypothetical protein